MESLVSNNSSNKASKLFRRYSYEIYKSIVNPIPLSWSLYSQEIIDRFTLDKCSPGVSKHHQISALLEAVLARLDIIPDDLDKVLEVLKEEVPDNVIIEKIKHDFLTSKSADEDTCITDNLPATDIIPETCVLPCTDSENNTKYQPRQMVMKECAYKEFRHMQGKLGGLILKLRKIVENNIPIEDLKQFLIFSHPHLEQAVKSTQDTGELFVVIRHQCTLTNYTLLYNIVEELDIPKGIELIDKYSSEEDTYKRRLLSEKFIKELQEESKNIQKCTPEIIIDLKLEWSGVDNITVREFRDVLRDIFSKLECYIHLKEVRQGCVHCNCTAPLVLTGILQKLAHDRASDLVERGVVQLVIGGMVIMDTGTVIIEPAVEDNKSSDASKEEDVLMNTLSKNVEELDIDRQDSEGTDVLLTLTAADRLISKNDCELPSVTVDAPPLPQDVAELLHLYLLHQECKMDTHTCETCDFLNSKTRSLLNLQLDTPIPTTFFQPHPLLCSLDKGLGRSISNEDEKKLSLESIYQKSYPRPTYLHSLSSGPAHLSHTYSMHSDPALSQDDPSVTIPLLGVATARMGSVASSISSSVSNSMDRSSFDSGIGSGPSESYRSVDDELSSGKHSNISERKKHSPLIKSQNVNTN